ncbi:MAG: hypothetical protein JSS09_09185, partial [Verrucomicrobia bacterium]|nr:hypothetical protein [Verrucomicrobiota bacterium]
MSIRSDLDSIHPTSSAVSNSIYVSSHLETLPSSGKATLAQGITKGLNLLFKGIPNAIGNEISAILPKENTIYERGTFGLIQKILASPVLIPLNLINSTIVHTGSLLYDTSNTIDVYCFQALAKSLESYQNRSEHSLAISISSKTLQALFCAGPLVP